MNLSASRRTWEEASSPAAVRLAREYEQAWRDSEPPAATARSPRVPGPGRHGRRTSPAPGWPCSAPTWPCGGKPARRSGPSGISTATPTWAKTPSSRLIYEEFCLREEDQENPDPAEYLSRFPQVAVPLRRVLEIHELVGSGTTADDAFPLVVGRTGPGGSAGAFPEAGQTIAGFFLVEELGRGAFARVFLARERQLADRPVALKVTRRGSREPQTLARLQHTHIVPVHSHRIDAATGLHLLCMPYFGRITLARVLADPEVQAAAIGRRPGRGARSARAGRRSAGGQLGRPVRALDAGLTRGRSPGGAPGWPRPSTTPTTAACSTATSSRRTCW